MERRPTRDVNRAGGLYEMWQVEIRIEGAVRRGRGNDVIRRGRSGLPASHAVDQVVYADNLDVDVAPRGVDQVIAANSRQVAVTGVNNDVQLRIGQLKPGSERNGATVSRVERIEIHVPCHTACAA